VRQLFTPRWLGRHLVTGVGIAGCVFLGRWQYHRSESSSGTLRNGFYALQWIFFAAVIVVAYTRFARAETSGEERPAPAPPPPPAPLEAQVAWRREGAVEGPPPSGPAETDPEVEAYNAYLRQLSAHPRR